MMYGRDRFLVRTTLMLIVTGTLLCATPARATYSIVAVDTVTGAVGGAGASCIAGSVIINDIIEGIGAVHTQAWYLEGNQDNAHTLLAQGLTPDSIISWLDKNDVEGQPELRQYGAVTLAGPGASASYTGSATSFWAGHIVGPGYAIQGNILLGPEIVQDMETAYLTTEGPLEDKLMAALEAANVPGADTRCLSCNKPAISAFIKVVHIGDGDTPYLYENVNSTNCGTNPMDWLWLDFNEWALQRVADPDSSTLDVSPTVLPATGVESSSIVVVPLNLNGVAPIAGATVALSNTGDGVLSAVTDNGDGSYSATITAPLTAGTDTITAAITAGGQETTVADKAVVRYIVCGDAGGDLALSVGDAVSVINYVFKGGPPPDPLCMGDANSDSTVNVSDAVFMITYVFKGGPAPAPDCCSPPW